MIEEIQTARVTCDSCGKKTRIEAVGGLGMRGPGGDLPEGWQKITTGDHGHRSDYCPACVKAHKKNPTKHRYSRPPTLEE